MRLQAITKLLLPNHDILSSAELLVLDKTAGLRYMIYVFESSSRLLRKLDLVEGGSLSVQATTNV